jgi:hypothetical protein
MRLPVAWMGLALTPLLLLLAIAGIGRSSARMPSGSACSDSLSDSIWAGPRREGLHLYGWNYQFFGIAGSYPSHPNLDITLSAGVVKRQLRPYVDLFTSLQDQPRYILDRLTDKEWVAAYRDLIQALSPPLLSELDAANGGKLLKDYRLEATTACGLLYRRLSP